MRFFTFLFGVLIGVGGAVAYMVFANPVSEPPPAVAMPEKPPFSVMLGESLLTELLKRGGMNAPGVKIPPGALRAELRDGKIIVHADVDVLGQASRGTAVVRPVVNGGLLQVEVVEANLGTLPLPALQQVLDEQVNARLQQMFKLLPVTVTGVQVTAIGLTVSCQVDLDRLTRPLVP